MNNRQCTFSSTEFTEIPIIIIPLKKLTITIDLIKAYDSPIYSASVSNNENLPPSLYLCIIGHQKYINMYPWHDQDVSLRFDNFGYQYPAKDAFINTSRPIFESDCNIFLDLFFF